MPTTEEGAAPTTHPAVGDLVPAAGPGLTADSRPADTGDGNHTTYDLVLDPA
ncbi:hypothetical protein [Ornithinimicrobium cavernae]|uniref:hypothetical protein n=1 Tax=Ornithinimicrobium cavernae TaxID=2666047 RepID=UPI001379B216|nr:hypothetical protein [Ornithinimicrobium cavernae]